MTGSSLDSQGLYYELPGDLVIFKMLGILHFGIRFIHCLGGLVKPTLSLSKYFTYPQ